MCIDVTATTVTRGNHWFRKTPIIHMIREFRDVVFEDVVFDNNSSVTQY